MVPLDSFAYDISAPNFQNNTCMPTYYLTENGFSILSLNLTSFSGYVVHIAKTKSTLFTLFEITHFAFEFLVLAFSTNFVVL